MAKETLFIDDLQVSCDAAQALGFHTYCPKANSDWRDELKINNSVVELRLRSL